MATKTTAKTKTKTKTKTVEAVQVKTVMESPATVQAPERVTGDVVPAYETYDIRTPFLEYFEQKGIDLTGTAFVKIPTSTFEGAFRYIYRTTFAPLPTTIRYNNKKTRVNLRDINELNAIVEDYIDLVKEFNIFSFDTHFYRMIGIDQDTWQSWKNEEYNHDGASAEYSELYKKIHLLSREQNLNKLGDDPIGRQTLANNSEEVGLNYNYKRQQEAAITAKVLTTEQLFAKLEQID